MSDDELVKQAAEDAVQEEESEAKRLAVQEGAEAEDEKPKTAKPPLDISKGFVPHDQMPEMTSARSLEYCPIDTMPPDYCEWGGKWDQCKPWVLEHYPDFYPELAGLSLKELGEKAGAAKATEDAKKKMKELPGGKKKRESSPKLVVKIQKRQGRKCITSVYGLEPWVAPEAAAKVFKKKFACGSAAVKGGPGQQDCVEIQGDPGKEELIAVIKKEFPEVPYKKIDWQDMVH